MRTKCSTAMPVYLEQGLCATLTCSSRTGVSDVLTIRRICAWSGAKVAQALQSQLVDLH